MRSFMSLFVSSVFVTFMSSFLALDTVTPHQLIKDGDKLVSAGGTFELGFFSPGNSKDRYLGIWYVASPGTVVWVANREDPIRDSSGVLKITGGGVLKLVNITDSTVWSSNASATAEDAFAQLLDSGNLVVRDSNGRNQESYLWQSFDYPCDTFLQRMKVGKNLVTGLETFLSSWKSAEDPAPGEYSLHLDTHGFPQMVIRKGSSVVSRFGPLNVPTVTADPRGRYSSSKYQFIYNESEIYVEYRHSNSSVLSRYALNPSGTFQHFTWVDRIQNWVIYSTAQTDQCQNYAWCGAYGSCNSNKSPVCECLKGFNPKSPKVWSNGIWFDGCERRTELNCHDDGFLKYLGVKLPDTSSSLFNETMDLKECGQLCLKNCSCTAYANLYIEGIGCLLWFVNLIDISELSKGGQDLYVRVAASELVKYGSKRQVENHISYPNIASRISTSSSIERNCCTVSSRPLEWPLFNWISSSKDESNFEKPEFVFYEEEVYYKYELMDGSIFSRIILIPSGIGQHFVWRSQRRRWEIISANLADQCDNYALCGAYSICSFSSSRVCACLKGFVHKNAQKWNISYWSYGCVRGTTMDCNSKDGFKKYTGIKLPNTSFSRFNKTMSLE